MAKLKAENICIDYFVKRSQRLVPAVQDVSFEVEEGQFLAIVGPSGCGKTTLLNVIAGLLPVKTGTISLDGEAIAGPGRDRAMVFQSPALMPWRTVISNVMYGLELQGHRRDKAHDRAKRFIDLVGLKEFEESYPHELSGGMQQRVNLARALAIEPRLLLLDEPLSALDAQTREYMQLELQRIWQEAGTTAIYVTHQIDEAIFLADQVMVMSARPGQVKAIVPISLPRPRTLAMKRQSKFNQLENQIWELLQIDPGAIDLSIQPLSANTLI
ncbi:ABC transporter ATP-binding protein [Oscillatoria sp. FACHB-1407]|uniref:ABC transporter ATP-binding protein n=1 Tax=Oscillatoria sp. FACHB-1407 TaxID=2692847 RepID=UPI001683539D|nr:ABC transporter ATP-binding protein [Oscillatoria sp. FACHB-1407]MBD2461877.1 ABC transporter ATP-binding protein [Oscillatoria sp. FACHB-1407]